jgi:hypothetical protein
LGLLTLYFGYAEYELDAFLERLAVTGILPDNWSQRPLGQKLTLLTDTLHTLYAGIQSTHAALLAEARELLDQRNSLIHGCILAGGRVVSGRSQVEHRHISANELTTLAERVFDWKERMWAYRWKEVEPRLAFLAK